MHPSSLETSGMPSVPGPVPSGAGPSLPTGIRRVTVGRVPEGGLEAAFAGLTDEEIEMFLDRALFTGDADVGASVDMPLFEARLQVRGASQGNTRLRRAPEALEGDWWVEINEESFGPLSFQGLQTKWEDGVIGPDSLCWREGFGDWVALSRVPEAVVALLPALSAEGEDVGKTRPWPQSRSIREVQLARTQTPVEVGAADIVNEARVPSVPLAPQILLPELTEPAQVAVFEPRAPFGLLEALPQSPPVLRPASTSFLGKLKDVWAAVTKRSTVRHGRTRAS